MPSTPATPSPCRKSPQTEGAADDGTADPARPAPGRAGPEQPLLGRRVLIVEDEAMLACDLEWSLVEAGAEVLGPALTLAEAQALVEREQAIDAAILDVDLAGRTVFPVARRLAAAGVPFVFHTGHADRGGLLAEFPAAQVMLKPQLAQRLIAALGEMLG